MVGILVLNAVEAAVEGVGECRYGSAELGESEWEREMRRPEWLAGTGVATPRAFASLASL